MKPILSVLLAAVLLFTALACTTVSPEKTSGSESPTETEATSSKEITKAPETSSETEISSEDEPEILHIMDGILLKYLVDGEVVCLVVNGTHDDTDQIGTPYVIYDLVDLIREDEETLRALNSGTPLQVTYITEAEGLYPLPVKPLEIVNLEEGSEDPGKDVDLMPMLRAMAELGYLDLIDYEVLPTFLLMMPAAAWKDYPVTYEYSEDGRVVNVYYELKREDEAEPIRFTLATFAMSHSGDEPGGDIGFGNNRVRMDGPDYLYVSLPRYAFDYVSGKHDFYFYPEEGNRDNEIRVTLTDEELKTLIFLQTGLDESEDYDALRSAYLQAVEDDDTDAMTEVNQHMFRADEWLIKLSEENVSINGLKPMY